MIMNHLDLERPDPAERVGSQGIVPNGQTLTKFDWGGIISKSEASKNGHSNGKVRQPTPTVPATTGSWWRDWLAIHLDIVLK